MAEPGIRMLVLGVGDRPETFLVRLLGGLAQRGLAVSVASRRDPRIPGVDWVPAVDSSAPRARKLANLARLCRRPGRCVPCCGVCLLATGIGTRLFARFRCDGGSSMPSTSHG